MRSKDGPAGITAAFVIGVEASQQACRPPVRHATADATAFADALGTLGVPAERRVILIDRIATKTTIESRLRKLLSVLGPDDTLAIFFAGYAFAVGDVNYLVAHDSQPDDLVATAVPLSAMTEVIAQWKCGRLILFLDLRPLPDRPSDINLGELESACSDGLLAFLSREPDEDSHASDTLGHGVWAHLLIEALSGNASAALDARHRLTPRSLQRYLADELPRALRRAVETPVKQTPVMIGRPTPGWSIADLSPVVRARRETAGLLGRRLERVALWSETRTRVKDLAGFHKSHHVPDRVRPATVRFVAAAARDDLQTDLDSVYATVREHLGYRRKDVTLTPPTEGAAALRTPEFDYLVSASLAPDNAADVVFRREVTHVRSANLFRRPAFHAAFGTAFQGLSFEYAAALDVERLVDRLEDEPASGVRVRCAADGSWCEVDVNGFPGTIRVEGNRLDILGRRVAGANTLWAAFEAFQRLFNGATAAKALPPAVR